MLLLLASFYIIVDCPIGTLPCSAISPTVIVEHDSKRHENLHHAGGGTLGQRGRMSVQRQGAAAAAAALPTWGGSRHCMRHKHAPVTTREHNLFCSYIPTDTQPSPHSPQA